MKECTIVKNNNPFTLTSEQPHDRRNAILVDLTQSSLELFIGIDQLQPIEDRQLPRGFNASLSKINQIKLEKTEVTVFVNLELLRF